MLPPLTVEELIKQARIFADVESTHWEPSLYGATDGKAVGTYVEHKFTADLALHYSFAAGNSASGIDLPALNVDIKVTSIQQPQSSCPYKSARQKIYGLGYSLLVFVYAKKDDPATSTGNLDIQQVVFVDSSKTADFQMTSGLQAILNNQGNEDDLIAFMSDKNLPCDAIELKNIATDLLADPTKLVVGCLTISNALQWRLQYKRAMAQAGVVAGVLKIK
jgi:hypothetical protein